VQALAFAVRKRASRVFTLDQYMQAEILMPEEKQCLIEAVHDHRN
jgi:Flp pilus assembly CpaF family ATPase